jgi:hypothetical protein
MLLTDTRQYALLDFYFPNGCTVTEGNAYLEGIKKGIELHQEHLKNRENEKTNE